MSALWKVSGAPSVSSGLGGPRHCAGLSLQSEAEVPASGAGRHLGRFLSGVCGARLSSAQAFPVLQDNCEIAIEV